MKKISVFLIVFFVVVSVFSVVFYSKNISTEKETNVSYDDNAEYPDELRSDNLSENENDDIDIEKLLAEDELTPDENFVDFDVEETDSALDEIIPEEESEEIKEEVQNEPEEIIEDTIEEPVEDTIKSSGKEIEIINSKVNIRREPNREAKILTAVPIGERGILLEEGDGWALVQFGEIVGYLGNSFWKFI